MRKLALRPDELAVDSFDATPGAGAASGTVRAHDSIQYCPSGPSYCGENQCNTETGVCGPATQCAHTCDPAQPASCGYTCGCGGGTGTCTLAYECCA